MDAVFLILEGEGAPTGRVSELHAIPAGKAAIQIFIRVK